MRTARKLTLFAVLAAAALGAPSALAQFEPLAHNQVPLLSVQEEIHGATDVNCPLVTPTPPPNPGPLMTAGGCRAHIVSPMVVFTLHISNSVETIVATCGFEADVRMDSAGEGYLSHQELTGPVDVCKARACGQVTPPTSEGRAWSFYMRETEPAPTEVMVLLLCTETLAGMGQAHCEFSIPLSEPVHHGYRAVANDLREHITVLPTCEMTGTFDLESTLGTSGEGQAEQRVEIRHS